MLRSKIKLISLLAGSGGSCYYFSDDLKSMAIGIKRFGRAALTVTQIMVDYRNSIYSRNFDESSDEYLNEKSMVHKRSAEKLLDLCCLNGGAFIKVGQHLGSLEYLLPYEYVSTLKVLHSKAPIAPLEDIHRVLEAELNDKTESIFETFEEKPLGAASLAQVHRAKLKDGREVAVKVQYPQVRDHSNIDMKGIELLVKVVSKLFSDFKFEWLVSEMKTNLPKELDFNCEGHNAENVAKMFSYLPWLKVPSIIWPLSTSRVLTMEYCEGGQVNDLSYMRSHDIDPLEVSRKLADLYSEMIFVKGFVHCDPHPGNVLVEKVKGHTYITLLDHGLYTNLPEDFRLTYCNLWMSILRADLKDVEKYARKLGIGELFGLFTCMLTARSWSSIEKGINKAQVSKQEQNEIRTDAAKYMPQISEVLNRVPREMLLILKTNDLIRGIEYALNTNKSMKSFIEMSRCCIKATFDHKRRHSNSKIRRIVLNFRERFQLLKLQIYSLYLFVVQIRVKNLFSSSIFVFKTVSHS